MIASLTGQIRSRDAEGIVLDVGGVGYRVAMPARSLDRLDSSREVFVHTYLHVREDVMCLYGFTDTDERDFFEMLKSVSGVGPKVAIGILSAYGPADLRRAVLNRDVAIFQSISGIGKKTAERLVLELKDKVGELGVATTAGVETGGGSRGSYQLAREALVSLGYNFVEAETALAGADPDTGVEELVRGALKRIGNLK
ncbi:MAG: Holliday junction branch migration protein RuvA [Thermoleophilia bacterium]|nr:Holliday junction branch migration protein RuvA [Thermoleophilia bacterium]